MTPQTGQHVKVILSNGVIAEGIVEEWHPNTVQLRSIDGESILIINKPTEDIMLIKIILEKPKEKADFESVPSVEEANEFAAHFQEVADSTDPYDNAGVKTLAQLRIELNKQERRIIAEKLKEHRPGIGSKSISRTYNYPGAVSSPEARRNQYGYPGSSKKPSTK